MRGLGEVQGGMFSYISTEQRVPGDHPLRRVRALVAAALQEMSPQFSEVYARNGRPSITLGGDKGFQEEKFIDELRAMQVLPHIAEYAKKSRQWPNWLTKSEREAAGYALSQRKRKLVEKAFGWIKFVAGLRKTKFRRRRRVDWMFRLAATACNLVRIATLIPSEA